ncbi:MAG: hypothetical protein WC872_05090 [Candidatus Absconditabacterales bacterium]|jgi:hypothetical protein
MYEIMNEYILIDVVIISFVILNILIVEFVVPRLTKNYKTLKNNEAWKLEMKQEKGLIFLLSAAGFLFAYCLFGAYLIFAEFYNLLFIHLFYLTIIVCAFLILLSVLKLTAKKINKILLVVAIILVVSILMFIAMRIKT